MSTPIIDKIRALLKKAERGATSAEAALYIEKAQQLMTAHGIQNVTSEDETEKPQRFNIVQKWFQTGRQRYETDQYIASILRACYQVKVLWSSYWENIPSKTKKWSDGSPRMVMKQRLTYVLVGDETDVEMATMIIVQLNVMMRSALARYLREQGKTWSAVTCHSFFDGLQVEFIKANEKGAKQAMLEAGAIAADAYALVVVDKEKAVQAEYSRIPTVRARGFSGPRSGGYDDSAYEAGEEVGSKLKPGAKQLK